VYVFFHTLRSLFASLNPMTSLHILPVKPLVASDTLDKSLLIGMNRSFHSNNFLP
jgi:hypothetical protein